jgi:hypothetical protein
MHAETIHIIVINPKVKSATIKVNLLPIDIPSSSYLSLVLTSHVPLYTILLELLAS